jgi:tRNA threonylcarbamoyl adenosine modification protein YeaZ
MHVLAIDSSSDKISVAVFDSQSGDLYLNLSLELRSSSLVQVLASEFQKQNLNVHDLGLILTVSGPGSFTGIRTSATVAKTLSAELNIKIFSANKFELLRYQLGEPNAKIAIPAGKNDYFVSLSSNYTDFSENYFTLELPDQDIKLLDNILSLDLLSNFWKNNMCLKSHYFDYESFQPYYLREPSIGKVNTPNKTSELIA